MGFHSPKNNNKKKQTNKNNQKNTKTNKKQNKNRGPVSQQA
jgi:hypothetical protein